MRSFFVEFVICYQLSQLRSLSFDDDTNHFSHYAIYLLCEMLHRLALHDPARLQTPDPLRSAPELIFFLLFLELSCSIS